MAKDKKGKGSGSKDACYHKVKSRYSVWPSAYASGALVKCRKVGAANWGNKSESFEVQEGVVEGAKDSQIAKNWMHLSIVSRKRSKRTWTKVETPVRRTSQKEVSKGWSQV